MITKFRLKNNTWSTTIRCIYSVVLLHSQTIIRTKCQFASTQVTRSSRVNSWPRLLELMNSSYSWSSMNMQFVATHWTTQNHSISIVRPHSCAKSTWLEATTIRYFMPFKPVMTLHELCNSNVFVATKTIYKQQRSCQSMEAKLLI